MWPAGRSVTFARPTFAGSRQGSVVTRRSGLRIASRSAVSGEAHAWRASHGMWSPWAWLTTLSKPGAEVSSASLRSGSSTPRPRVSTFTRSLWGPMADEPARLADRPLPGQGSRERDEREERQGRDERRLRLLGALRARRVLWTPDQGSRHRRRFDQSTTTSPSLSTRQTGFMPKRYGR